MSKFGRELIKLQLNSVRSRISLRSSGLRGAVTASGGVATAIDRDIRGSSPRSPTRPPASFPECPFSQRHAGPDSLFRPVRHVEGVLADWIGVRQESRPLLAARA